ncbi:MAG: UDP-N-acetylmuramate dehydrogenase [Clostridium sp.]|nr:UDP-N-acetylmuramate dehydrogenase [Clostridium sp.]
MNEEQLKKDEPMKNHTTFRIGGPAMLYASPVDEEQLARLIKCVNQWQIPFFVLGNGSNLLVSDKGYQGVVIEIKDGFNHLSIEHKGDTALVRAGAGILLSKLAKAVADESLQGFEFAAGIPGTLGGAVTMNAGAYGGEIKEHIIRAKVISREGELRYLTKEELNLSYRHSAIMSTGDIVVEAEFEFPNGVVSEIKEKMKDFNARRREKQPLEYPSAGSTFKRPEGYFAGKLIQDAGLRGFRIGDVMVSEKHCGFVVNVGEATAAQVKELIDKVSEIVEEKFGVHLEPEVRFLGEF